MEAELSVVAHVHVDSHHSHVSHVHVHWEASEHGKIILIIITHQKLSQLHLVESVEPIHVHHVHTCKHVVLSHVPYVPTHVHEVTHVDLWIHAHSEHRSVTAISGHRSRLVLDGSSSTEVNGLVLRLVEVNPVAWRFCALLIFSLRLGTSECLL